MKQTEAVVAVSRMYAAHGLSKSPDVVGEMVREVMVASCGICASAILEENRTSGTRPHTVPTFRGAYHAQSTSVAHGLHAGQVSSTDVGAVEATWRSEVTHKLEAASGKGRQWSRYMAARMWASGAVTPDQAVTEALAPAWANTIPEGITDELVEAAYDYARAMATNPDMANAEFEAACKPWADLITAAGAP